MINYDHYANNLLLQAIIDAGKPHRPIQLMAHLLMAERRWLDRCNEIEPYPNDLWPKDFTTEHCAHLIEEYHEEWLAFINKLSDEAFHKIISYQNTAGVDYQTSISDILAHLINHGTHTRAQAGQQLKLAGAQTLPITDYSYYLRQINS